MLRAFKKLALVPMVAGCVAVLASLAAPSTALGHHPGNHRHYHHGHHHCHHHHSCYPCVPGVIIPPVFRAPVYAPAYYPVAQPVYYPVPQPVAVYSVYYRQSPYSEWTVYGTYPTPLAARTIAQNLIATGYQAQLR